MNENTTSDNDLGDASEQDISKSQRKREHLATQQFIKTLIELPRKQLTQLPLPAHIIEEVVAAGKLTKSALKRQVGFIAKRIEDQEVQAAQRALIQLQAPHKASVAQFHQHEQWRDELLDVNNQNKNNLIEELVSQHNADRQKLRQLMRNAAKESNKDQSPKSARALFQYLSNLG